MFKKAALIWLVTIVFALLFTFVGISIYLLTLLYQISIVLSIIYFAASTYIVILTLVILMNIGDSKNGKDI